MIDSEDSLALDPALDFLQRIWKLSHALERLSKQMDRHLGITAQQRLVLRCLGKYPGTTAGQLAGLLHLDPGTISSHIQRLEKKRLVDRRTDARDRRRALLGLTAKGRELARVLPGTVEHAVEILIERLGDTQVAQTKSTLALLAQLISDERPTPPRSADAR